MNAVDSLAIHLVGVCLWVGGLAALLLIARRLGDQLQVVVTALFPPRPDGASRQSPRPE